MHHTEKIEGQRRAELHFHGIDGYGYTHTGEGRGRVGEVEQPEGLKAQKEKGYRQELLRKELLIRWFSPHGASWRSKFDEDEAHFSIWSAEVSGRMKQGHS